MSDQYINSQQDPWADWVGNSDNPCPDDASQEVWADFAQESSIHEDSIERLGDTADSDTADFVLPDAESIKKLLDQLPGSTEAKIESQQSLSQQNFLESASLLEGLRADAETAPSQSEGLGASLDPEMREAFLDDASICIGAIEAAVMQLDESDPSHDALIQISRNLHTLKGASASVGLTEIADRLHELEEKLREDQANGKSPPADIFLESLDWFRFKMAMLGGSDASNGAPSVSPSTTSGSDVTPSPISSISNSSPAIAIEVTSEDDESVRVRTSQLNRLMDMLADLVMLRNRRQTEISDLREIYHELIGSVSKLKAIGSQGASYTPEGEHSQLHEVAADVLEVAHRLRACTRPVTEGNQAVSQFIRNFRQELVELRRSPAAGLFQRLKRAVHDAARAEEKIVSIECLGASVAIERSLQQRLYEPLLHIVRNAVCHGIESAVDRKRSGKPTVGSIVLETASTADLLVIEVRDDGGGLNYSAIRKKAIQSGLLSSDQSPTEQELAQLIFHPGFSTRDSADRQAGRGIGMDVVATTLQRLGGWFEVNSIPGQGTTIRLSVPLASAIEHLMVFRSGGQLYSVPMLSVRHAGVPDPTAPRLQFSSILGEPVGEKDGDASSIVLDWDSPKTAQNPPRECNSSVNVNSPKKINLIVDEIIGPEEVVIRPLPPLFRHHPYCSSATISGGGQVVLVLDIRRLASRFPLVDGHPVASLGESKLGSQTSQFQSQLNPGMSPQAVESEATDLGWNGCHQPEGVLPQSLLGNSANRSNGNPSILVVDDSVSSRKLVVRILNQFPVTVVEASDGRQALQLLKSNRFAAIFSDLEMPFVDGLELLSEVRSRTEISETPFTIISSRTDEEIVEKAESLGVLRYLNKPVTQDSLISVLSEIEPLAQHVPSIFHDSNSEN